MASSPGNPPFHWENRFGCTPYSAEIWLMAFSSLNNSRITLDLNFAVYLFLFII
jgi:hypothetical protein